MTYPFEHKIIKPFAYTSAANTDIRILFEKVKNAGNSNQAVLAPATVSDRAAQWEKPDFSCY